MTRSHRPLFIHTHDWTVIASGAVVIGLLGACGPQVVPTHGSVGTETSETTTTGAASSTSNPDGSSSASDLGEGESTHGTGPAADDGSDGADDMSFVPNPDVGEGADCDPFTQDCPPGLKCMPYSNDGGGAWNDFGCFRIDPDPAGLYEPCTMVDSGTSGLDDCALGLMCWYVDPKTLQGVCYALCTGHAVLPSCEDPGSRCTISSAFALCVPVCDPLGDDCTESEGCYPINDLFVCGPDDSEGMGAAGEPCTYLNECTPGAACVDPGLVPDCMSIGCCTSMCHLEDPMPPCLPGQQCVPWYAEDDTPPGFEHVGGCVLREP